MIRTQFTLYIFLSERYHFCMIKAESAANIHLPRCPAWPIVTDTESLGDESGGEEVGEGILACCKCGGNCGVMFAMASGQNLCWGLVEGLLFLVRLASPVPESSIGCRILLRALINLKKCHYIHYTPAYVLRPYPSTLKHSNKHACVKKKSQLFSIGVVW